MASVKRKPATAAAKRIVTRADDVGSFHSANIACYEAYKRGVLRNGGFIVPGGRFDEAVEMFKGEKGFCCGVHTALTCEWLDVRWRPVLAAEKIPSAVRVDGTLHHAVMDLFKSGATFAHMFAEIQAQVDKARKRGLDITYVDSHMNCGWLFEVHGRPRFSEVFQRWAEREGLIAHVKLTGGIGIAWECHTDKVEELAGRIRALQPGTYMMVGHSTFDDGEMRSTQLVGENVGEQAARRDLERLIFMDPAILQAYKDNGVEPIRFDEV